MASEALFLLLKLNLVAGVAILAVLALRGAMRAWFGARIGYALWLTVPAAAFAVMLPARTVAAGAAPVVGTFVAAAAPGPAMLLEATVAPQLGADVSVWLLAVWATGTLVALCWLGAQQRAFVDSLGRLTRAPGRVLRANAAGVGPAIIGALWPRLVLPSDFEVRFSEAERGVILAHERVHMRAGDPMINALAELTRCINWFNPLVHLGVHAMRIDQELACDAAVIAQFPRERRRYAEAMLKTQLDQSSVPLGCLWPARTRHPLRQRIAMLKRDLPGAGRRVVGVAMLSVFSCAAGISAWSAQPAIVVNVAHQSSALFGGLPMQDDVDRVTPGSGTALIVAARWGRAEHVRALLDLGADPNLGSEGDGNPLINAAKFGHQEIVAQLIARGADVNAAVPGDETPLINAARWGHFEALKMLVEAGADVNLVITEKMIWPLPERRMTALGEAQRTHRQDIAAYLKSRGARM